MLEVIRFIDQPIRFYNAGSSECFGDTGEAAADELTPFQPRSPYAVAKASAHWLVRNYRESYGIFACTGLLFNHESPLRPERFVTQKIVRAAARISKGSGEALVLGNIDIRRDWGWSPDYVDAMWRMLQQEQVDDFVIATGRTEPLEYFVSRTFDFFGWNWRDHVQFEKGLFRPADNRTSRSNPAKARDHLDWSAQTDVDGVVWKMCEATLEMERQGNSKQKHRVGPS
jgi:GDPmannose 4,6-dehydratase